MPYDPMMAQAIYQAIRKGLLLSGLIPQEADRIAQSVQQMYQSGQIPNVTNPLRDPGGIFNAVAKGLGPAAGMATPVGNILTGAADPGIPESFMSPGSGVWAPPLPIQEEPDIRPAPISRLSGALRRDEGKGTLDRTDYLYGGQTPVAITPPRDLPIAALAAGGPGPSSPSNTLDAAGLLRAILAALGGESAQAMPRYNPLADSENYAGATNLPATPIGSSWLTRKLGLVGP